MAITADKVVTILEAKTEAYDAKISNSAKQFEAKIAQISAAAERAGKATSLIGVHPAFDKFGKQLGQGADGLHRIGTEGRMAQMQMRNLAFQFQDIGTMLAAGQSPFMLLAQQLPQVTMYGGSMNGVMGALRGTIASLFSPLGLATTAFVLLGSTAISYFTSAKDSAEGVNEFLEAQRKRIDDLIEGYERAGEAAQRYRKDAGARPAEEVQFEVGQERSALVDRYNASITALRDNIRQLQEYVLVYARGTEFEQTALQQAKALEEIQSAADAAEPDLDAIILQLKQFIANDPYDVLEGIAKAMLDAATQARDYGAAIGEIDASTPHINAAEEAFRRLRSAVDEIDSSKARGEIEDLVSKFEEGEISVEDLRGALELISGFAPDLSAAISNINQLADAADTARLAVSGIDPNINPARFGYSELPQNAPTPTARPNDFTVQEILDDQQRAAARAARGRRGGAGRRENSYERLTQQIQARANALRAETEAQAELNPLVSDYGYAAEKARIEAQLLTAAENAKVSITPELQAAIEETSVKYASASAAAKRLAEEQKNAQQAAEELQELGKDVLGGFIDDLRNGVSASEALANALQKVADKLLDMALNNLLSGLLGGAIGGGGLLGGAIIPGILHSGGVAGRDGYGHGRTVSPSVFTGAKRYHQGGIAGLRPGEVPAILQKGEVVIPNGQSISPRATSSNVTSISMPITIDARDANAPALARVNEQLKEMQRSLPKQIDNRISTRDVRGTRP
ncbi:phage tail length tape measure family protein [Nitratireductor sp. PBL-C9]|uniref:phage tail length tape measure family protein n=1 Tax=Nitratireductor sp. PBL-C9 TaxID=3435013 RepID=UPI003D7C7B99